MKNFLICSSLAFAMAAPALDARAQNPPLKTVQLLAGKHAILAEVAATENQRELGLMYRDSMNVNGGMLFVFGAPAAQCMWMRNTELPLSVAFLDASGKIINIEDMQPHTLDSHCSTKAMPARYALEMNLGWFRLRNIKPGMVIGNLPPAK